MTPKIAIIGAGPGGLCLANILQRGNVAFTVFEGDKSPHERSQGGTLDLHPQSGQLALKEAGLWDEFCQHSRPEGDVRKIVSIDGTVLWDGNGPDKIDIPEEHSRPEIDREKLKDILLQNLQADNLKFNMHLQQVRNDGQGKYDLEFREGVIEGGFDLVVGADGAWSKVRRLLTDVVPHYSGISCLELWVDNVNETNPWLSQYVGEGTCFCFSEDRAVIAQRMGDSSIRTYACVRQPENHFEDCGIDFSRQEEARNQYVEKYFGDIGADLKRLIVESNSRLVTRTLYMLPVGFRWDHKSGITLLGDAAHLMTPFGGVGVNAALADALDLGHSIIKIVDNNGDDNDNVVTTTTLSDMIQEYEARLFPRGEKFAARTWQGLEGHFSANGSEKLAKRFRDAQMATR